MTTFKQIRGTDILALSSDPANPEEGQIWYNSSSGTLKGYVLANVNAWASGGNLNTARYKGGAAGTQTAALTFAGQDSVGNLSTNSSESYNGTSWTSSTNYPFNAEGCSGIGTQTAAIGVGGGIPSNYGPPFTWYATVNTWNGSSWTATTSYPTPVMSGGIAGTQTATIYAGGTANYTNKSGANTFNGSSWTSITSLPAANQFQNQMAGTQTAAILVKANTANLSWNGSSWTSIASLNTSRNSSNGLFGSQTAAVAMGGNSGPPSFTALSATELYNGTAWTSNPNGLAVARSQLMGFGTQSLGLAAGASSGSAPTDKSTEEWTGTQLLTKTITVS